MTVEGVGEMQEEGTTTEAGLGKRIVFFIIFLALALGYYLSIDYILMVFAQNLPFPYK
ncbi:MAG: hypothetical protein HY201_04710 [Nitrospirae bacterium]|nr:hypothetical protein [Candidatus Troglogloeales bacterium]MBI3598730.1 hypothetical protein [Candidatus Troglogloeales bacterium]